MKKSGWSNKTKAMRIVGTKQLKDGGGVGDINQVKIEIEPQYYDEKNNRKNVALKYDVNYLITFNNKDFIELTGTLKPYHTGRDYDYEFEVDYFADQKEEDYYEKNSEKIKNEILDKFYSKKAIGGGVGITEIDIKEGVSFKNKSGTTFVIDKIELDPKFGKLVSSSLLGGKKGNYRDEITDFIAFLNKEKAVKHETGGDVEKEITKEDCREIFYVMDETGKVKNISVKRDDALSFLQKSLKGNGKLSSKVVLKNDWNNEKINISNIKSYKEPNVGFYSNNEIWGLDKYAEGGGVGDETKNWFSVKFKLPDGQISWTTTYSAMGEKYAKSNVLEDFGALEIIEIRKATKNEIAFKDGGIVGEKWQIKDSNDKYFSVSMQTGNPVWNESPDLGYSYEKQEAEKIKDKLVELGTKDLKVVEYNPNWWKMKTGGRIDDISDKIQEGDIVWDERNKRYGVVLNTYDYQYGEIRLDSDGNQPIEYLHKLGSEGDKGTKVKLQNALIGYKSLRLKWPEYKYEKVNYADGGKVEESNNNFQEIDGNKYFTYNFENKGNKWSVLIGWDKYNHVNVTKKTNNPFGNRLGTEFKTIGDAVDNYKDVNIKSNILFAGNMAKEYGYEPKYADGGLIDINDFDMPVIRSQFEEEEFEFGQGGGIYSRTMKTPDGNIIGKVRYNDFWKTYQVVVDGVIYEEFKNKEEAIENLKNAGFDKMALGGGISEDIKIKDWYTKEYSSDDMGKELNDDSTFKDLENAIFKGNNVYSVLGVSDSVVRERAFAKLSKINNKEGQWAYNNWIMYSDKMALGGGVEKANFGYLLIADKMKNLAPKSFDAVDEKFAERIKIGMYADGGSVEAENKEMVLNNNNQIAHHTEEMNMAVKNAKNVPAWVVAKVNRSATDLSDATHYMEGQGESYADGGGIGFIPMDLEEKLAIIAKWGGTNIKGVIGILNAMIDSGLTNNDLKPKPTKNTRFQIEKATEKKIQEIWKEIKPNYKGNFEGNKYYSTLKEMISRNWIYEDVLAKFKPFRKYQKPIYADGGGTKSMFNSTKQKMQGKTQQERIDSLIEFVSQSKWSSKPITVKDNAVIVFSKMYDLEPIRVASIFNKYQGESYADGGGVGNNFYALTSDGMKNKRKEKIQSISYWKGRQSTHKPTLENIKEFLSQVPFDEKICIYIDDDNSFYGQLHSAHVPLYTNGAESVDAIVDNNNNIIWNKYKGSKYEVKVENYKMETGGEVGENIVGEFYFDTRKDKAFRVISNDGTDISGRKRKDGTSDIGIQYYDNNKKPIGNIETINSNEFNYYVKTGAWNRWKQSYFKEGGEITNEIAEIKAKIEKAKKNTIMPENLKKQYIEKYEKQLAALTLDKGTKEDVKDFLEVPKGKTPKIVKVEPKKSKEDELAEFTEKIMIIESDILDNLEISSGGEIKQNDAVQKKYIAALDKKINANMFKGVDVNGVRDILEDENYHTLNNYLGLKGYYGESGKNDYKSYYDRNITKGNKIFLNPSFFGSATKTIEPKKETKSVEPSKGRTIRAVAQDKKRTAKKAGKRTAESGNTYYESRENRSDKNQKTRLEKGGATKGWKHKKNN